MRKKLVQFGAGNIGRSFIAQVFSQSGYDVVFVDVSDSLVQLLNERGEYRVITKQSGAPDYEIMVGPVRAVNGKDEQAVANEIASATLIATAVGKNALTHVLPVIARSLAFRFERYPDAAIDLLFAENVRHVAQLAKETIDSLMPEFALHAHKIGFVESSIGKMVPIMRAEDLQQDPLWVFAEPYNSLILDGAGFKGALPCSTDIKLVRNISAYVDRKLFIHNLGHAAAAYLGWRMFPQLHTVAAVTDQPEGRSRIRAAMQQAAAALHAQYPADLPCDELNTHIDDLLYRFRNHALGDTVFRVGRDLPRKLHVEDRLLGAMCLAEKHHMPYEHIATAAKAALFFEARSETGELDPADVKFLASLRDHGTAETLRAFCGFDADNPVHAAVLTAIDDAPMIIA